jgi:hypothetical protein
LGCAVTTAAGVINNDAKLKIGEMRFWTVFKPGAFRKPRAGGR